MIKSIQCVDFQDLVTCKSSLYQSKESFLKINYTFHAGNIYGLISDFGCGSWGTVSCLGGRFSKHYTGQIIINNGEISPINLAHHSAFVGEHIIDSINSPENLLTPKECIEKSLTISKLPFSIVEIKDMFGLSDERFVRNLEYVSGEINRISIAINFALGRDVFCFPWLNEHSILNVSIPILNILRKYKKTILIPTSQQSQAKKFSDHLIVFEQGKIKLK